MVSNTPSRAASRPVTPGPVSHKPDWVDDWRTTTQPAPQVAHHSTVTVNPRSAWTTASPITSRAEPNYRISRITVHHDGMNAFTSASADSAAKRIEAIRRSHVGNGWADIGYHYVIDPAGRVWEGRPVSLQGAHVRNNNEENLGIMCLGNYNNQSFTRAQSATLVALIHDQMARYSVNASRLYTHQELVATACPGRSLQAEMVRLRTPGGALGVLV